MRKLLTNQRWWSWGLVGIVLLYLATHLVGLVALPVFADEAIYIRWTQLIMDEPARYALFPLNDGKTPLFIWSMLPFQYLFSDQLWAGRLVAVLVGLAQVLVMGWSVKLLGGRTKTQYLAMALTMILPYWFFHHRMALMDGMMTLWLSLAVGGAILVAQRSVKWWPARSEWWGLGLVAVGMGLALLSKMPAVLFVPILGLAGLLPEKTTLSSWLKTTLKVGVATGVGLGLFALLKLHPAFGQLFSRGSDFLYPVGEVVAGKWRETVISFPNYLNYFNTYLSLPVMGLVVAGLFSRTKQRVHHWLFWSALIFLFPIMIMGKVVYPRYLLPAAIFFTLSAALAFEHFNAQLTKQKSLIKQLLGQLILVLMLGNIVGVGGVFMAQSWFNPTAIPFVKADQVQYLYEWSAGFGNREVVELITDMAKTQRVAVATEGYFGTLPDGILMYLHRRNVTNLYVEGVGQPVVTLTEKFLTRAKDYDRILLVVNSHRMKLSGYPERQLLQEYCRPNGAPCLQVWELTN